MAILSLFTNCISIFYQDGREIIQNGFFFGYTPIVYAIIVISGSGGLLVAAVIRYTSNLAKSYTVSLSIFATQLLSYCFIRTQDLSLEWTLAACVVVLSTLLYIEPNNSNQSTVQINSTQKEIDDKVPLLELNLTKKQKDDNEI